MKVLSVGVQLFTAVGDILKPVRPTVLVIDEIETSHPMEFVGYL